MPLPESGRGEPLPRFRPLRGLLSAECAAAAIVAPVCPGARPRAPVLPIQRLAAQLRNGADRFLQKNTTEFLLRQSDLIHPLRSRASPLGPPPLRSGSDEKPAVRAVSQSGPARERKLDPLDGNETEMPLTRTDPAFSAGEGDEARRWRVPAQRSAVPWYASTLLNLLRLATLQVAAEAGGRGESA